MLNIKFCFLENLPYKEGGYPRNIQWHTSQVKHLDSFVSLQVLCECAKYLRKEVG